MSGPITAELCQTSSDCYIIVLEIGNWAAPKMRALQLTWHTKTIHVTICMGLSSTLTCCITFQHSLWQEPCVSMQLFHEMKRTFWAYEKLSRVFSVTLFILTVPLHLFLASSSTLSYYYLLFFPPPLARSFLSLPLSAFLFQPLSLSPSLCSRPQNGLVSSNMWFLFIECKQ